MLSNQSNGFCDDCGKEIEYLEITPVVVYPDGKRNMVDVCEKCYKQLISDGRHIP